MAFVLAGAFAPLPYNPVVPDAAVILLGPSADHWAGTDGSGFDVFSRTIAAAANDIPTALLGTLASLAVGLPLGLLSSTNGRWSDAFMRGLDVFQSFPIVILSIVVVTIFDDAITGVIVAIMIINVPRFARLARSEAVVLRQTRFIEAAQAVGVGTPRLLRKHLLPNVLPVTLAQTSLAAAHAMVVIAALSFLGAGVTPPEPSWGYMIQEGARAITIGAWWVSLMPGLAIFIVIMSFNLIADGLLLASERSDLE
ncbi:ABC transporter permease [Phytohabitans kaempferiae]|uniref:ABC transporter permease n=1 Tax=Phytohabitans kaempferiae TaxID=1620943 RepID=A0ABV6M2W5_9ACTN